MFLYDAVLHIQEFLLNRRLADATKANPFLSQLMCQLWTTFGILRHCARQT